MKKYKIVASKSQKKYTIILSADSEAQVKEKIHKEGYSILTIGEVEDNAVSGNKFLFQVEKNGEVKNGVIVGTDILKVYVKLRKELEYNVLSLYPEGDEAHTNAEKKQKIIDDLKTWYDLQKGSVEQKFQNTDESFYLKKQLEETYKLIENVLAKFEYVFSHRDVYNIDDATLEKLQNVYNKLVHIKSSTNLEKLKEVWELALIKIAKLELASVETKKDEKSRELLKSTNSLLKELGSREHFIERDKDVRRMVSEAFMSLQTTFSLEEYKKRKVERKKAKEKIDKHSYNFLKTTLLLEKYQEKQKQNNAEIRKNLMIFLNPFASNELKETLSLKRKVISQNITILKAKKEWWVGSYTSIKKGYHKIIENFSQFLSFLSFLFFIGICMYSILFLLMITLTSHGIFMQKFNANSLKDFLLIFCIFLLLSFSRNIVLLWINIVFFVFLFIFSRVNF